MRRDEARKFAAFRKRLYKGDDRYVGTAEFVLGMLLKQSTAFARACEIKPIAAQEGGRRAAQTLAVAAPHTDYVSLAFFDCERGNSAAAARVCDEALNFARGSGRKRLVVGLNAHLSYGVGLLTRADFRNTFDTCYNKTYYADFFRDFPVCNTLTAYRCEVKDARERLKAAAFDTGGYSVRKADFGNFRAECETMRRICDETIGQTYLYAPTDENHFFDLLKDMKIIMNESNLLFLTHCGKEVGFLFWHPDYNAVLRAGKSVSALGLALGYAFKRNRIDTVKLNSIGVEERHRGKGTLALLKGMNELIGERYKYIETNFVWDRNVESTLMNRRIIGGECRKFAVFEKPTGV